MTLITAPIISRYRVANSDALTPMNGPNMVEAALAIGNEASVIVEFTK